MIYIIIISNLVIIIYKYFVLIIHIKDTFKMNKIYLLLTMSMLLACMNTQNQIKENMKIEYFTSDESEKLGFPFSDATIVDNIIYVSGQVGTRPGTTELISGGIGPETTQALNNIKSIINQLGGSSENIFKCLCMLSDINDYSEMNEAYSMFFDEGKKPSRSTFAGSGLALGAEIEIECWAVKK